MLCLIEKSEALVAPIDSSPMHLDAHEAMWVLSGQVCINWHTRESPPSSSSSSLDTIIYFAIHVESLTSYRVMNIPRNRISNCLVTSLAVAFTIRKIIIFDPVSSVVNFTHIKTYRFINKYERNKSSVSIIIHFDTISRVAIITINSIFYLSLISCNLPMRLHIISEKFITNRKCHKLT